MNFNKSKTKNNISEFKIQPGDCSWIDLDLSKLGFWLSRVLDKIVIFDFILGQRLIELCADSVVRPESCFSELSWTYSSCDYSAFHYLALE